MGDIQPGVEPGLDPSVDPTEGSTPMLDGGTVAARLDEVERRLRRHSQAQKPDGLTEPDEGGTERWEAGQVWAHMAEFVGYWHGEIERVISSYDGDPVPFGRTKEDAGRVAAIEAGRSEPIADHMSRVEEAVAALKRDLAGLTSAEWNAVGRHPTRGDLDVEAIVETFIVGHLEEHADQLDGLTE
jgi:hypothetical protein